MRILLTHKKYDRRNAVVRNNRTNNLPPLASCLLHNLRGLMQPGSFDPELATSTLPPQKFQERSYPFSCEILRTRIQRLPRLLPCLLLAVSPSHQNAFMTISLSLSLTKVPTAFREGTGKIIRVNFTADHEHLPRCKARLSGRLPDSPDCLSPRSSGQSRLHCMSRSIAISCSHASPSRKSCTPSLFSCKIRYSYHARNLVNASPNFVLHPARLPLCGVYNKADFGRDGDSIVCFMQDHKNCKSTM